MLELAEIYFTVFNVSSESVHECYMSPDSGCVDKQQFYREPASKAAKVNILSHSVSSAMYCRVTV